MTAATAPPGPVCMKPRPPARGGIVERPILMNGWSVRGIRAGRKLHTRRVIKPKVYTGSEGGFLGGRGDDRDDPHLWGFEDDAGDWWTLARGNEGLGAVAAREHSIPCPYGQPGDYLYVKETWSPDHSGVYPCLPRVYRADGYPTDEERREHVPGCTYENGPRRADCLACAGFKWRPSIFMPKDAARIWLRLTEVRVERLHAISDEDVLAEGVTLQSVRDLTGQRELASLREAWRVGWDHINGRREHCSWADNPWLWVLGFEVHESL